MPTVQALLITALGGILLVGAKDAGNLAGKGIHWSIIKTGCVIKNGVHHIDKCKKPKTATVPKGN